MARLNLKTAKLNLKGVKTERLLRISGEELASLSTAKLERLASRLMATANKRVERLEAKGITKQSGAYYRYIEGSKGAGGTFVKPSKVLTTREGVRTKKQKSVYRNELLSEVSRTKRFLQAKTSTITGTKANIKHVESKLKKAFGSKYYDKESGTWKERDLFKGTAEERAEKQSKFWDMYYKSMEKSSQFYHGMSSKRFRNRLSRYMEKHRDMSDDEILRGFEDKLREDYERSEEREQGEGSVFY